jgi:hypothetical protein
MVLLARIEAETGSTETRRCAACGEVSPATFDLCWKCGNGL